jgi:hypothetical protein
MKEKNITHPTAATPTLPFKYRGIVVGTVASCL